MITKESFSYPSTCAGTEIHAVRYLPQGDIKGILQIAHGMAEFIERYEPFACYLAERGILVTGNDHLGHGESVQSPEDYGYCARSKANAAVLEDLHTLTEITRETYPGIPYVLMGHSMGSFYVRQFLCEYGRELDGAIIVGTGNQPEYLARAGKVVCASLAHAKGWRYRSTFVNKMAFGKYNERFEPARTPFDWLTRDPAVVDAYVADERTGFLFTLNGFYTMFTGISRMNSKRRLSQIPKDLPILFTSGEDDPVGEFTKGVLRAVELFRSVGMNRVEVKFYPGARHEILNEIDRETVYDDLYLWLEDVVKYG